MKTRTLLWVACGVLAASAAVVVVRRQPAEPAAQPAVRPVPTVGVFVARRRDVPVTIEAAGTVVSLNTVDVRPQVAGTIAEAIVREGQFVRAGDLLFRLDDRADHANLDKARAQLARDMASLADLERQLKRSLELRAQNFIAQSATDSVQSQVEAQRAAVEADRAAQTAAEVQLGYDTIRSPLAGRVGAISVFKGTLVQPTGGALVTISQIDPIGVSFTVPEAQLGALLRMGLGTSSGADAARPASERRGVKTEAAAARGEIAIVVPDARRAASSADSAPLVGRVDFVDNAVDTATGTIRVKGRVGNAAQRLWPGQYVQVRMTTQTLAEAIVVPQAALIIRGSDRSVYVVDDSGHAELRGVRARYPLGELVVVEGIDPGDKVVVDGQQNLRPGVAVRLTEAKAGGGRRGAGASTAAASGAAP